MDPTSDRTAITSLPLDYAPGTRRMYGPSLDWAGFMVEQLTGLSLEDYFQQNIFAPLGITDISFDWSKFDHINMAYRVEPHPAKATYVGGDPLHWSREYCLGGGGLYGSAPSYLKFLRALLPKAEGHRLLKEETLEMMYQPQLENDQQRKDVAQACNFDLVSEGPIMLPEVRACGG